MTLKPSGANLSSTEFVDTVLRLRPQLAAFDCDGTLWAGDAGEGFFRWEFDQGFLADEVIRSMQARYADYRAGKVSEDDMCGEMVTMHRGLKETEVQQAATRYFDEHFPNQIFPEMRDLVRHLQDAGCEVWAVSSTNEWVIRAAMQHFGIPGNRILAAAVDIEHGVVTDRLVRIPSGPGKPKAVRKVVQKSPDAAFGNSRWDADLLQMAQHAFAVNPNPDLEAIARQRGWQTYFPARR